MSQERSQNSREESTIEKPSSSPHTGGGSLSEAYRAATGIVLLLISLGILWVLARYGPGGADWIGDQTRGVFGLNVEEGGPSDPAESSVPETEEEKIGAGAGVARNHSEPAAMKSMGDPRVTNARIQISKALGEKASVEHVAFSRDDSTMVAAIRVTDSGEILEIYFEMDEFGRYISVPDSPVDKEIKIWKEQ